MLGFPLVDTVGSGAILRIIDILIQEKEGPEGSGRKTFKIETQ
jgi:hypothetical protein